MTTSSSPKTATNVKKVAGGDLEFGRGCATTHGSAATLRLRVRHNTETY